MTKQNKQNIKVDDVVIIDLPTLIGGEPFKAVVTKIHERHKSDQIEFTICDGEHNKIGSMPDDDGHLYTFCDIRYAKLHKAAPYKVAQARNMEPRMSFSKKQFLLQQIQLSGNPYQYIGHFHRVVEIFLRTADIDTPYDLHLDDAYRLWVKQNRPGFVYQIEIFDEFDERCPSGLIVFNRKHLCRWIKNNQRRFVRSRTQWIKDCVEIDRDVDFEMESNL